jgi:two-component sensor histidine kinase
MPFRQHPATLFLRNLPVAEAATVSLRRVIEQRAKFAELSATAMLEPALDVLLQKAAQVSADACDAPMAKVLEHRPEEGEFLVRAGIGLKPGIVGQAHLPDGPDHPAGEAFRERSAIVVRDVRRRPDYHLSPIYGSHHVVSSANVPVMGISGIYGVLEVDAPAGREFDALDVSFLGAAAAIIADAVERVRRFGALQAAHDARELLLREHHHRVRNSYQVLLGSIYQHPRAATTENSRRRFGEIERQVFALATLYDHLVGGGMPEGGAELGKYISELCERMRAFYHIDESGIRLDCSSSATEIRLDLDRCTAVGAVVNELVANALEHAFADTGGTVGVRLEGSQKGAVIAVTDNGAGFAEAGPASTGLSVAGQLISSIGGAIQRQTDGGTTWKITLTPGANGAEAPVRQSVGAEL